MHELSASWEIDGKWHVKPSVGPDGKKLKEPWKGRTLKVFDTEQEANNWSKHRSKNYKPKRSMSKKSKPYYDSILRKMDQSRRGTDYMDTKVGSEVSDKPKKKKKKKSPKPVMYGGSMNASSMRKDKDEPVAAMPGYHMQKRDKY